jgi:hypothetical protein
LALAWNRCQFGCPFGDSLEGLVLVLNQAGAGFVTLNNGYWDFDRFNPGETDTLQGWNSLPHPYSSISGFTGNDRTTRWFFCMDWGNNGNYKGNSFGKKGYGVLSYWHVDGGSTQAAVAIANTTPVTPSTAAA